MSAKHLHIPPTGIPSHPYTAEEIGRALGGIDEDEVRELERAGELFSIVRPARGPEREYPAFQIWSGIYGEPMSRIRSALGTPCSTLIYGFFTSASDLLGFLTPIEVLLGQLTRVRDVDVWAQGLLAEPLETRMDAVLEVAKIWAEKP